MSIFKQISDLSVDEQRQIVGGEGLTGSCYCSCNCNCSCSGCSCECDCQLGTAKTTLQDQELVRILLLTQVVTRGLPRVA